MTRFTKTLLLGLSVSLPVAVVQAQYNVDSTFDGADANPGDGTCATVGGICSLRAALQEAAAGGTPSTIVLPEGTYEWTLGELMLDEGDIEIQGAGTRTTIVDANAGSRFLDLTSGVTRFVAKDLEWRNGLDNNDPGGAIETNCDDVLFERVAFRNCETGVGFGGALHNRGHFEAYACLFLDCVARANDGNDGGGGGGGAMGAGGAVSNWTGSSTVLENCTFYGCKALGGDGGDGELGGNGGQGGQSFSNFGEGGNGGDIGGGSADENAGAGNIGGGGGGGGYSSGWAGGTAGTGGNGVLVGGNGAPGASNGGGAGGGGGALGGAIFSRAGTHILRHCTFHNNEATPGVAGNSANGQAAADGVGRGGAIGMYNGDLVLDNCLIHGNSATGSPSGDIEDLYLYSGGPILSDVGHNLVGVMADNTDTEFETGSVNNLIGVDPLLLPFGDYGGPTDACMISACDPLSPAIDAGASIGVAEDQRGTVRDALPDIGAIEGPMPVDLDPLVGQICPGETVELTLTWPDAVTTWPDGSEGDTWQAPAVVGVATITTAEGCVEEIDVTVTEVPIETPDLGPDQIVCPGTPVFLDAGNAGAQFAWSSGGNGQTTNVLDSGTVVVTVGLQGCIATDEMVILWYPTYPLDLGGDVTLCYGEDVTLDAGNPAWGGLPPTFAWTGGPNDPEYTVDATGVYTVSATLNGCTTTDQVVVTQSPLTTVDLGADQTICPGEPFILNPNYPTAICTWQNGVTAPTFNVTNTGIYSVNVVLGDCQANDQVFIEVVSGFDAQLPAVANYCQGDSVLLLAAFGASNYTWQNGATGNQLWASQPGIYQVSSTVDGCTFTDQVSVVPTPLPQFELGLDIILCEGESTVLAPGVAGADYVIFNDSLTTPTLTVTEPGTYTAEVAQAGCIFRDTVTVEVRPIPEFDLPEDSLLCPGTVLTIATGLTDVLVTWSTGEVGTSIDVNEPATYVATSQVSGCQFTDSMKVEVSQPITIPLEADYELCLKDSIELSVLQGNLVYPSTYRWDNGSVLPVRTFSRGGLYTVEVTNVCDTAFHIFEVEQLVCGCQMYVPNSFTPNNDGNNDAWFPVLDCNPHEYQVTVWDRWGRPVFHTTDPDEVWYGQVEGTPGSKTRESGDYYAIDGVYMWEVIIELRNGRIPEVIRQNGYVRILR